MGPQQWSFQRAARKWLIRLWWAMVTALAVLTALSAPLAAQPKQPAAAPPMEPDLKFSAHVDRTEVEVGTQFALTLTLEGQMRGAELQPLEFPDGFIVLAQSRASNVSVRAGAMTKSLILTYVLIAQEPGTFQLGPFHVVRGEQPIRTDPIDIVVKKPVLPPGLQPNQRHIL